jgi:drug/metabolite transporter (DMT)-like permease
LPIQPNDRRFQGYLFAFLAAKGYGSASTLGKLALGSAPPILIASFGSIIGGLILLPYKPTTRIERKSLPLFALIVLCGSVLGPLLFYNGLRLTSAVVAALLSNGELLFTSIIAIAFFKESLNRRQYVASLLVVFGIVTVSTSFNPAAAALLGSLTGSLYILGAMLSWGIENNLVRRLSQRADTLAMARWRNLAGGLILLAFILLSGQGVAIGSSTVPYVVLSGLIPVGLTTLFLYLALGRIGAVRTLLVFSTGSLFGTLYAHLFLGEAISSVQLVGGAVLFLGIVFVARNERN